MKGIPRNFLSVIRSASLHLLCILALLAPSTACRDGQQNIVNPPPVGGADFTLTLSADQEDVAIAGALGWNAGIPDADLTITPIDSSAPTRVLETDDKGVVVITDLSTGRYIVPARRLLSAGEAAQLADGGNVVAFVGEGTFEVSASLRTATVRVPTSNRRSIVISEWSFRSRLVRSLGDTYLFGGYLELYNNSDTTVFLDRMLILKPWAQLVSWPGFPCESTEGFRNDPAGPWSQNAAQFPGTGDEYPLAPGATVVIATDAIDHRGLFPGMLDLTSADFEFLGVSDVDNPAIRNMIDVGTTAPPFGHGLIFPNPTEVAMAVASAQDVSSLPRRRHPEGGPDEWIQVSSANVLDAIATASTFLLTLQPPRPFCQEMLIKALDRQHGFFLYEDEASAWQYSIARKVLAHTQGGRPILQHTRTSASDFHHAPRTPGVVQ